VFSMIKSHADVTRAKSAKSVNTTLIAGRCAWFLARSSKISGAPMWINHAGNRRGLMGRLKSFLLQLTISIQSQQRHKYKRGRPSLPSASSG
jgi:hypothetical protein